MPHRAWNRFGYPDRRGVFPLPQTQRFLDSLPPAESESILTHCSRVTFQTGQVLFDVGDEIRNVYLPLSCVVSLMTELRDGRHVESASVGQEGIAGLPALVGGAISHNHVVVQVAGEALQLSVSDARRLAETDCPAFHAHIGQLVNATMTAMAQSAACLAMHPVVERCARWLLSTSERVKRHQFHLTQEALAAMLGVHRPSVTIACQTLQKAGLIRYHRGDIEVANREGLLAASCECYGVIRDLFDSFLGDGWA